MKAKHGPKAEVAETDEALEPDAPDAHFEGPSGAPPPLAHAEPDGDEAVGAGEACPHCGSAMAKKPMAQHKAPKHGLDAESLSLLLARHG